MSTYNKTSTYNRTYERKVIEEPTRVISGGVGAGPTIPGAGIGSGVGVGPGLVGGGGGGGPSMNISSSSFSTTPMFMGHPATTSMHNYTFGSTSGSYRSTDDSFEATMDVSPFKPDELKVSVIGNHIVVEARHSEKPDELGLIERHFIRKFNMPKYVSPDAVVSNLTHDGQLTITALPPKPKDNSPARAIPIKIVTAPSNGVATSSH